MMFVPLLVVGSASASDLPLARLTQLEARGDNMHLSFYEVNNTLDVHIIEYDEFAMDAALRRLAAGGALAAQRIEIDHEPVRHAIAQHSLVRGVTC